MSSIIFSSPDNPIPIGFVWVFVGVIALIGLLSYFIHLTARHRKPVPEGAWKGGVFCFNRQDPSLFVPKRFGIGYTINFANRWSWLVVAILVVLILAPFVFTAITVTSIRHTLDSR
ncbi:MAG: DUF5808 domain-containing protein [Candidatus Acidiferrales bacterium]